ncbi:hypothetical protein J7M28_02810 [bacterium]|nr:hypothetical protein [bacterium]
MCWVADSGHGEILKLSPGGTAILRRIRGFSDPSCIALSYYPGAIWVADSGNDRVVRLDAETPDGYDVNANNYPEMDKKVHFADGSNPSGVAVEQASGVAWAALSGTGQIVRMDPDGALAATISGFGSPAKVAVNSYRNLDNQVGLCWVADAGNDKVYKVDPDIPDGYNLLTDTGYMQSTPTGAVVMPSLVSVNNGGVQSGYTIEYEPKQPFGYGQVVDVQVEAEDLLANGRGNGGGNKGSDTFAFTTVERDTSAPFLANQSPPRNARNIPVDGPIAFDVLDRGTGINGDTVQLLIDGQLVFDGIESTGAIAHVYAVPTLSEEEDASGYSVVYYPPAPFAYNKKVVIEVIASDLAFPEPNQSKLQYSFTTDIDWYAPMVYDGSESPQPDATDVPINTSEVSIVIFDTHSGVDTTSVEVTVDGNPVDWTSLTFENWTSPDGYGGYRIYAPIGLVLTYDQDLRICIRAADLGGDDATGANWMEWYCWSFTTGEDAAKPFFDGLHPFAGETGVLPDTSIEFSVKDEEEGVDLTTLTMSVEGEDISLQSPNVSIFPLAKGFNVVYDPLVDFNTNTIVDVDLSASDLATPNPNTGVESYRFTLVDIIPPIYYRETFSPRDGETNVGIDALISVSISDMPDIENGIEFNSGIDENSVQMRVNGQIVQHQLAWTTIPFGAVVKYQGNLEHCSDVAVEVSVSDLEGNAMLPPASWSFKTGRCYPRMTVPESIQFDRTPKAGTIGALPNTKTLNIQNTGWSPLTIEEIHVTKGSGHFSFNAPALPLMIQAQDTYPLVVSFQAQKFGEAEGEITIIPLDTGGAEEGYPLLPGRVALTGDAGYPPVVELASHEYSKVTSDRGGDFQAIAQVADPDGDDDIVQVIISLEGEPWGELNDAGVNGDWQPGDGVYSFSYNFAPGVARGSYLVTIEAVDSLGYHSVPWPRVRVSPYEDFFSAGELQDPFERDMRALSISTGMETKTHSTPQVALKRGAKGGPSAFTRPVVMMTGFLNWDYTFMHSNGGKFCAFSRVRDDDAKFAGWGAIDTVELMLEGGERIGSGLFLSDSIASGVPGDVEDDGAFVLVLDDVPSGLIPNDYILEIIATDIYGNESLAWPYFHVE